MSSYKQPTSASYLETLAGKMGTSVWQPMYSGWGKRDMRGNCFQYLLEYERAEDTNTPIVNKTLGCALELESSDATSEEKSLCMAIDS